MVSSAIRERYLRDPLPVRLGGLAADLARLVSFSENPGNYRAVASLLEEGKYFAEWAAPEAPPTTQALLARVQVALACWEHRLRRGEMDPLMRQQARRWSRELLRLAGLV